LIESIEIALSAISLLGMALVARHETRLFGFIICSAGNIGWIVYGLYIWHVPYLLLFGGYLIFNSVGVHDEYATWKKIKEYEHNVKDF
jgi:hypothetical protein